VTKDSLQEKDQKHKKEIEKQRDKLRAEKNNAVDAVKNEM